MIKLHTYAGFSLITTLAVIYHAFSSREQFYPAMVYLSTSKICLVLLLNMGMVFMCILWQLIKKIFLGPLREPEVERLNEQSWRELMEILFAITIFRQDFSITFLAMVTTLLLIKSFHWLAQKRVEYIETTPTVSTLSHVRIVSFMCFLFVIDSFFFYHSVKYLIETRQASVSLFFSFEYMILATSTLSTFVKYAFYVSDMLMDGQWERKAVYTFYLELIRDLLHLSMYLCFFLVIFVNYGIPLHLIRELYETFRNFKIRVADCIRYRKITSNMNDRFPNATPEELSSSDITCIICREEMTTAKRLACGHLFHVHCLRSWLERQQTCPTCRALVVPPEDGTSTTRSQANGHQEGTNVNGATSQGSPGGGVENNNVSLHQVRLQAAAAAASVYEKSFVYPSANTLVWSSGYAVVPQTHGQLGISNIMDLNTEGTSFEPLQHTQFANMPFVQVPQGSFTRFQSPGTDLYPEGTDSILNAPESQLDAHKKLLERHIEVLEKQLLLLNKGKNTGTAASDIKGKSISTASSSTSDCLQE